MPRRNPEPVTLLLIGAAALAGWLLMRRRKAMLQVATLAPLAPLEPATGPMACPPDRPEARLGYDLVCDRRTGEWVFRERVALPCPPDKPPERSGYRLECHGGQWKYRRVRLQTAQPLTVAQLAPRATGWW